MSFRTGPPNRPRFTIRPSSEGRSAKISETRQSRRRCQTILRRTAENSLTAAASLVRMCGTRTGWNRENQWIERGFAFRGARCGSWRCGLQPSSSARLQSCCACTKAAVWGRFRRRAAGVDRSRRSRPILFERRVFVAGGQERRGPGSRGGHPVRVPGAHAAQRSRYVLLRLAQRAVRRDRPVRRESPGQDFPRTRKGTLGWARLRFVDVRARPRRILGRQPGTQPSSPQAWCCVKRLTAATGCAQEAEAFETPALWRSARSSDEREPLR